jgi:hypothetical protein
MHVSKATKQLAIALGDAGEDLVKDCFEQDGWTVVKSGDPYDASKDLVASHPVYGSATIEVKTQVPWVNKNALTIKPDQLKKCSGVDYLVFVTIPPRKHSYHYGGWIMKVDPKQMKFETHHANGGREMVAIPIDQPAVELWRRIPNNTIVALQKLTISNY